MSLVVGVILIILIAVVAFVLYSSISAEQPMPRTQTQTTLSPNPGGSSTAAAGNTITNSTSVSSSIATTYSSVVVTESNTTVLSSSGLELMVDLNTTEVAQGGSVAAQFTLFNSLDQNLSLVPSAWANSTLADWNNYDSFCGGTPFISMVGYALFQGYYTGANISQAPSPLHLAPSANIGCVTWDIPATITFLPDSHNAVLYQANTTSGPLEPITESASTLSCASSSTGAYYCGGIGGLYGYWNTTSYLTEQQVTTGSPFLKYFPTGDYTLAVQDMWNQTIYAHFQVVSTLSSPVEVISVVGPVPPYNPGGPVVSITLKNSGEYPLTSLNATLRVENVANSANGYSYAFANSSSPLLGGLSATETRTLIGAGFDTDQDYPLTITGTFANGTQFSYAVQVQIEPPSGQPSN